MSVKETFEPRLSFYARFHREGIEELLRESTGRRLKRKPGPDKWSIGGKALCGAAGGEKKLLLSFRYIQV